MTAGEPQALSLTRGEGRLVVASNRLPIVLDRTDAGWDVQAGSGGLVTAMSPVLREHGGCWVGWPGTVDVRREDVEQPLAGAAEQVGFDYVPVLLSQAERDDYYYGFANEVLWPLLHDLQTNFRFAPRYWDAYRRVNRKFSRVLQETAREGDYIWVHDYHLMGVAEALRGRGYQGEVGYFLHTPFPPEDILMKLPWRAEILEGLLHYDLLGFQTSRDRRNFVECVRRFAPEVRLEGDGRIVEACWAGRSVRLGAFPIGIDFDDFAGLARSEEVERTAQRLRTNITARRLVLSVNRLDYTKGIPNELRAFHRLLERDPDLRGDVSLVQVVVPSREHIPEYDELRKEVERLVGEVNGRFGADGWVPVHFHYRSMDRPELVAHYREADVALVTPLKDGMNLVAKEYCAASVDGDGVLVLSEFAGSAAQLQDGALLVNPYDTVESTRALRRALRMDEVERRERMRRLREVVRQQDIHTWLADFARAARGREAEALPELRDYAPGIAIDGP